MPIIKYYKLIRRLLKICLNTLFIRFFDCSIQFFIARYIDWIFVFIILLYSICSGESVSNIDMEAIISGHITNHMPHYHQFVWVLESEQFLSQSACHDIQYAEYLMLEASLEEIDYEIDYETLKSQIPKPLKYIQWHQLPSWSVADEKTWNHMFNYVMQTGHGYWIDDFEKICLRYVLREYYKDYVPPKYTTWRYMESLHIASYLYQLKNLSINLEKWISLKRYIHCRLHSPRKCGYLFRGYDTFMNLYCTYEIIQHTHAALELTVILKWIFSEYTSRQPESRLLKASFVIGIMAYLAWGYYPVVVWLLSWF